MKKVLFLFIFFINFFPFGLDHKLDENTLNSFKGLIDNNLLKIIENLKVGLNDKTIDFLKDYRMRIDEGTLRDLKDVFENVKIEIDKGSLDKLGEILNEIKIEVGKDTLNRVENLKLEISENSLAGVEKILKITEQISNKFFNTTRNMLILFFIYKIVQKFFKNLEKVKLNKEELK